MSSSRHRISSGAVAYSVVTLLPVDPFYRLCWEDGTVFDYADDQPAIEAQIATEKPTISDTRAP